MITKEEKSKADKGGISEFRNPARRRQRRPTFDVVFEFAPETPQALEAQAKAIRAALKAGSSWSK